MGGFKLDYTQVADYFKKHDCVLLTTTYAGTKQRLEYICSCGSTAEIEFRNFKSGKRCRHCSRRRAMETNRKNHGGVFYFQNPDFLVQRLATYRTRFGTDSPLQNDDVKIKREQTNLQRYRVKHVSQAPEIQQRQRQGFVNKYGVHHFMYNITSRAKFQDTLMSNFGVPSLAHTSRCSSRESQQLFACIYDSMSAEQQQTCYFATLNHEFCASRSGITYKYDFVNTLLKKCIEYNGSRFHPKPEQHPGETGWCVFHPSLTVAEARAKEAAKFETIELRGYTVLTVWDTQWHKNPLGVIQHCLKFLSC